MTEKEKYRILCAEEYSIPVYSRDWWLDCVCGKDKWEVLLYEKNGLIEASMVFYRPYPDGISMPLYTQTLGIWFNPASKKQKYAKDLHQKHQVCAYFIDRLPPVGSFRMNFHYTFTNWLPFYWKGYSQTTRYNYILPDIRNLDNLRNNFCDDVKKNIKKAKTKYKLEIKKNISTGAFLEINAKTFERQGLKAYHPDMLRKLIETSRAREQGNIWGAYDEQNRLHAAVFIVWQAGCAYCIAGGSNPELRNSGAHALVLWETIRELSNVSDTFDFEGSMIRGVEHFNREFGAIQMPYFTISKGKISLMNKIFTALSNKIRRFK